MDLVKADSPKMRIASRLTLLALAEKLQALSSGPLGIFSKSTFSVADLTQGFVCVDLSKVTSTIMKDMMAYTILQHIDSEMRLAGMHTKIRLAIVLDEAWKLCREEDSLPVTIIKEGRKYGYSLIVSSQDATADLAESILSNAGTVIIHHTEHPKYLNFFQQSYGLTEIEISRIKNAPIGEALAKIGDDPRPFFVRVEMEEVDQSLTSISGAPIKIANIPNAYSQRSKISAPQTTIGKISPESISDISDDARKLLQSIVDDSDAVITARYEKLVFNPRQGNAAKDELTMNGLIEEKELPKIPGKGRAGKVLKLTDRGYRFLDAEKPSNRFGGPAHRYMINMVARKFANHKLDYEYSIGNGKKVDLVIDGKIAVEVETRDFSESNITKNLSAGFEKVIIVCQTREQASQFRSMLEGDLASDSRIVILDIRSLVLSKENWELFLGIEKEENG